MATWTDAYGNTKNLRAGTIVEFEGEDWKIIAARPWLNTIDVVPADDYVTGNPWYVYYRIMKSITKQEIYSGVAKFRGNGSSRKAAVKRNSEEIWVF